MTSPFRFIPHQTFEGAHNMAIDEAILEAHRQGASPATLRIYGWEPQAVSIGYAQKMERERIAHIEERGFAVVRRPTGGRAVLHAGELTYSFVASTTYDGKEGVLGSSVAQAYLQICQGLLKAIEFLGVELSIGSASRAYKDFQDCFQATTNADLHYKGKKMIGSAQLRRQNGVLQHGSILLNQPQELMAELLDGAAKDGSAKERSTSLQRSSREESTTRHSNLFDVLGEPVSIVRLQEALKKGFEEAFGSPFATGDLTDHERELADAYCMKYQISQSSCV